MSKSAAAVAGLGMVALLALGAWWSVQRQAAAPDPVVQAPPPTAPAPAVPAPPAQAPSVPAVRHPLDLADAAGTAPQAAPAVDAETLLTQLVGRKTALGMFQMDDFARRLVATVDNLGRSHAPARLWPVIPAEGRFSTDRRGGSEEISADNGLRYTPYVLLIETVDLRQVVAAYLKLYPQLQAAYQDLGYPGRYFNDRAVEVIDLLLATPDSDTALTVRLPAITGPVQPQRPWVMYEFEDPALQALSAGQRLLLRTGPVNQRRLKARLAELRSLLATGAGRR